MNENGFYSVLETTSSNLPALAGANFESCFTWLGNILITAAPVPFTAALITWPWHIFLIAACTVTQTTILTVLWECPYVRSRACALAVKNGGFHSGLQRNKWQLYSHPSVVSV